MWRLCTTIHNCAHSTDICVRAPCRQPESGTCSSNRAEVIKEDKSGGSVGDGNTGAEARVSSGEQLMHMRHATQHGIKGELGIEYHVVGAGRGWFSSPPRPLLNSVSVKEGGWGVSPPAGDRGAVASLPLPTASNRFCECS